MRSSWGEEKRTVLIFISGYNAQRTTEHGCYFILPLHSEHLPSKLRVVQKMSRFRQGNQVILNLKFTNSLHMHLTY